MNLSKKPLAMAYVPWQTFENVMEGECALRHGTIFEDLVFPFVGAQAACQADRSQNHSHSGSCGCHNRQPYVPGYSSLRWQGNGLFQPLPADVQRSRLRLRKTLRTVIFNRY